MKPEKKQKGTLTVAEVSSFGRTHCSAETWWRCRSGRWKTAKTKHVRVNYGQDVFLRSGPHPTAHTPASASKYSMLKRVTGTIAVESPRKLWPRNPEMGSVTGREYHFCHHTQGVDSSRALADPPAVYFSLFKFAVNEVCNLMLHDCAFKEKSSLAHVPWCVFWYPLLQAFLKRLRERWPTYVAWHKRGWRRLGPLFSPPAWLCHTQLITGKSSDVQVRCLHYSK